MCQTLSSGVKELKTEKFLFSCSNWKRQNKQPDKDINRSDIAKCYKTN